MAKDVELRERSDESSSPCIGYPNASIPKGHRNPITKGGYNDTCPVNVKYLRHSPLAEEVFLLHPVRVAPVTIESDTESTRRKEKFHIPQLQILGPSIKAKKALKPCLDEQVLKD